MQALHESPATWSCKLLSIARPAARLSCYYSRPEHNQTLVKGALLPASRNTACTNASAASALLLLTLPVLKSCRQACLSLMFTCMLEALLTAMHKDVQYAVARGCMVLSHQRSCR